jgi:hypothetical protein
VVCYYCCCYHHHYHHCLFSFTLELSGIPDVVGMHYCCYCLHYVKGAVLNVNKEVYRKEACQFIYLTLLCHNNTTIQLHTAPATLYMALCETRDPCKLGYRVNDFSTLQTDCLGFYCVFFKSILTRSGRSPWMKNHAVLRPLPSQVSTGKHRQTYVGVGKV